MGKGYLPLLIKPCANTRCKQDFLQRTPIQKYCTSHCQHNDAHRKYVSGNYKKVAEKQKAKQLRKRMEVFAALGNQCRRCGFSDIRALQIDHVHGCGNANRESSIHVLYKLIAEDPTRYQILCANCNWIKRAERREFGKPKTTYREFADA